MTHNVRHLIRTYPRILIGLALFGALALGLLLYVILVAREGIPTPVTLGNGKEVPSVSSPEFVATLSFLTNTPIRQGDDVTVLNNGDGFIPDLISHIDAAQTSINFSTYIWRDGAFSREVLAALTRAAERGVTVRLLLDGFAGSPPKEELDAFRGAGGHVGEFRPIRWNPLAINNRNHRRAIVIDGTTGYLGGIAVADTWLGNGKSEDEWRDTMFRLEGVMAQSLDRAFVDEWFVTTGEILLPQAPAPRANSSRTFIHVIGSAGDENKPVAVAFILSALAAKDTLYITSPYFLPDNALLTVLEEKAREGVDVRVLVPGPATDSKPVRYASHQLYNRMLASGIRIYEYQPSLIHSKAVVVDGAWSLIGSANIDNRSRELNDENVMGIQDPVLATELATIFTNDLQYSKEITPEVWEHRTLFDRILSFICAIPLKQY